MEFHSEGLIALLLDGKTWYIDETGNQKGSHDVGDNHVFSTERTYKKENDCDVEGLYKSRKNGKYGYLNKSGMQEILCIYDWVGCFHSGIAEVKLNQKNGFIDKNGTQYWED